MKKKFLSYSTALLATVALATGFSALAKADTQMYRLYNPNSGEHFYTSSEFERDQDLFAGWEYEGVGWVAPSTGAPVYRLYNPNAGDHFYTVSTFERDQLVAAGWKSEGVGWYSGGTVPLYRSYNANAKSGAHNYSTSQYEAQQLAAAGWTDEGVGWNGVGGGTPINPNGVPHNDSLGYVVLTQQDPAWVNKAFGTDTIGESGCGLLSVIMAADALEGLHLTPNDVLDWANSAGAFPFEDQGQSAVLIAQHLGLKTNPLFYYKDTGKATAAQIEQINTVLRGGGMVLISGLSIPSYAPYANGQTSPFTRFGHYIVIKKLTADGKWMIFDSNDAVHPLSMANNNNLTFNPTDIMRDQWFYAVGLTK